jgi:hypothetical protein
VDNLTGATLLDQPRPDSGLTTETQTEPLPLHEVDTALVANPYDLDVNFDKVYSHYVLSWDADAALRDHTVATALCGFKWIPTREVGSELPMCPKCKVIFVGAGWK